MHQICIQLQSIILRHSNKISVFWRCDFRENVKSCVISETFCFPFPFDHLQALAWARRSSAKPSRPSLWWAWPLPPTFWLWPRSKSIWPISPKERIWPTNGEENRSSFATDHPTKSPQASPDDALCFSRQARFLSQTSNSFHLPKPKCRFFHLYPAPFDYPPFVI